jgi:hypothetical protein
VQELGPDQLRDALKYGLLASAAYSDEEDKVRRLAWLRQAYMTLAYLFNACCCANRRGAATVAAVVAHQALV